jgi:predicted permease
MFAAMIVGIVLGLTAVKMPAWVNQVVSVSGECMSPVAMLLTGITLSTVDFKKIIKQGNIYIVSFIRLIIIPAVALGVIYFIPSIPKEFAVCIVCLSLTYDIIIRVLPLFVKGNSHIFLLSFCTNISLFFCAICTILLANRRPVRPG